MPTTRLGARSRAGMYLLRFASPASVAAHSLLRLVPPPKCVHIMALFSVPLLIPEIRVDGANLKSRIDESAPRVMRYWGACLEEERAGSDCKR